MLVRCGTSLPWAAMCQTLAQNNGTELTPKAAQKRLRKAAKRLFPADGPHGSVIREWSFQCKPEKRGRLVRHRPNETISYASPAATMTVMAQLSTPFWTALRGVLTGVVGPYGLLIYNDGVTGGNVLGVAKREVEVVYWSLLQFGPERLSKGCFWLPMTLCRTSSHKTFEGGVATFFAAVMKSFFPQNQRTATFLVYGQQAERFPCEYELYATVVDESAQKGVNSCKGASGKIPCLSCSNCCSLDCGLAEYSDGALVTVNEHDSTRFALHTNESIGQIWDALEVAAGGRQEDLTQLEMALGWNWNPRAMLASSVGLRHAVRLAETTMCDPMHTLVANNGIMCSEVMDMVKAMEKETELRTTDLQDFCALPWHPGAGKGSWFDERTLLASKEKGYYRGSASNVLAWYLIVAHFCEEKLLDSLPDQTASFVALALLIDMVFQCGCVRASTRVAGAEVLAAAQDHLRLFLKAYPDKRARHKDHQSIHIGMSWDRFGGLSCFVGERKNKKYKQAGAVLYWYRNVNKMKGARI